MEGMDRLIESERSLPSWTNQAEDFLDIHTAHPSFPECYSTKHPL
jgi:hypothetical protein